MKRCFDFLFFLSLIGCGAGRANELTSHTKGSSSMKRTELDSLKRKESVWKDEQPEMLRFRPWQQLAACCKGGVYEQPGRIS
jgi:hypothetical protein